MHKKLKKMEINGTRLRVAISGQRTQFVCG